ncbi:MAG: Ppx/GppA family phosphatase [Deferribacteraceae bacterium]|jgi:exopolyphosphatase/guanosine-5'-triphosphate,3'-diphosphate pyrophosphatase|nr:Ppx/GppA family phosphatase [Deferribacteraceae bacterium]
MKIAVIDMGSNSFRLQVSDVYGGTYKTVEDYKEMLRIGDTVYAEGEFSEDAIERVIATLKRMRVIINNTEAEHIRIVGTAPFRDASNTHYLKERVKQETGFDIEVISGEEEARLIYLAATGHFNLKGIYALFVDIGGGSTELSFTDSGELSSLYSTPLGCSRITKHFVKKNKAKPAEIRSLKEHIRRILNDIPGKKPEKIVFTGGTVNAIAEVYIKRNHMLDSAVKYVDSSFLTHFVNELSEKSYDTRAKIQGMEAERVDISLAAALIALYLVKKYELNGFYSFSGGLRNGLTIDLLNKLGVRLVFQDSSLPDLRYSKLIEVGRKYYFEEEHALQVTKIAKKLFEGLMKHLNLEEDNWRILEAAALLHDVGQHIGFSKHHHHSYYLIKNSDIVGYTDREHEIVANTARYHRRSAPNADKHPEYAALPPEDKLLVNKLSAILRIADALDRAHISAVDDVLIKAEREDLELTIYSKKDVGMELVGIMKKKDLLESFAKKLTIKLSWSA